MNRPVFSKMVRSLKDLRSLQLRERALYDFSKGFHLERYRHEFADAGEPIYLELKGTVYGTGPMHMRTLSGQIEKMILCTVDDEGIFEEFRLAVQDEVSITEEDVFENYFFKQAAVGSWVYFSCSELVNVCYPEIIDKCTSGTDFKVIMIPYAVETVSRIGVSRWCLKYRLFSFELIK